MDVSDEKKARERSAKVLDSHLKHRNTQKSVQFIKKEKGVNIKI